MSLRPDRQRCAALALRVHRFLCAAERVLLRASQARSRYVLRVRMIFSSPVA